MSIQVYGFLNITELTVNLPNIVSEVGELSPTGYSYSRDLKYYPNASGTLVNHFNVPLLAAQLAVYDSVMNTVSTLFDNIVLGMQEPHSVLVNITNVLGPNVTNVMVGKSINKNSVLYPEWVSFDIVTSGYTWNIKIWLSDASFLIEYPETYIQVVSPLDNMQILYDNYSTAATLLASTTTTSLINKAEVEVTVAISGYKTITLTAFNIHNKTESVEVTFLLAYNGRDNFVTADAIITAVSDMLVSGGLHTLADWTVVIPELNPTHAYIVVPTWNNISVNNVALSAPLYSPTISVLDTVNIESTYFPTWSTTDFSNNAEYTTMLYKSLGLYIVPALDTAGPRLKFTDRVPDYMIIPLNDINIQQLSARTRETIVMLDELVRVAELYKDGDTLTGTISQITISGYRYLTSRYLDMTLSVMTRESYLSGVI